MQLEDPLEIFGSGELLGVTMLSSAELSVDDRFDGSDRTTILTGTDRLDPGERGSVTFTVLFAPGRERGPFPNSATAAGEGESSGTVVSDAAQEAILLPPGTPLLTEITVVKTGDRDIVARGEAIGYDVRIDNTSGVPIPAIELADDLPAGFQLIEGSAELVEAGPDNRFDTNDDEHIPISVTGVDPVIFGPFDLAAGESIEIRYATRVGTGVARGEHTNCATALALGGASNTSCWTVGLITDPIFERTTVIGKVFADDDRDGWQDPDERGIAGVRLATVGGLVIETDRHGRYHIADVEVARFERGANFILKLDESTLPNDAEVFSENPRVVRITEGVMARINFAVALPETPRPLPRPMTCTHDCTTLTTYRVTGQVSPVPFRFAEWQIPDDYTKTLTDLLARYSDKHNVRLGFVGHSDNKLVRPEGSLAEELGAAGAEGNRRLSLRRAREVCEFVHDKLGFEEADCDRVEGRGADEPIDPRDTDEARELNRRVEIELLYDDIEQVETTRVLDSETCLALVATGIAPSGGVTWPTLESPADAFPYCTTGIERSEEISADATGITVSGGPFGCNIVPQDGDAPGLLRGGTEGNAENTLMVVASGEGVEPDYCGHGITAGQFPIEVRTNEGSVHYVNREGDVLREHYPQNNNQWIVVTPFRDYTDNSTITALRISNLGIAQTPNLGVEQRKATEVWHSQDHGITDPRLDVLALDPALVGHDGYLASGIRFAAYTNYDTLIDSFALKIFGRSAWDRQLLRTIDLDNIRFGADIGFDGKDDHAEMVDLTQFTRLEYELEAYDCPSSDTDSTCLGDRTQTRVLGLLGAGSEAEKASHEPQEIWGETNLGEQHISIEGSRVRVYGSDFEARETVQILGWRVKSSGELESIGNWFVPVDPEGRFVFEQHLKTDDYSFSVITHKQAARGSDSAELSSEATVVTVSGGLFGCSYPVTPVLPGRERAARPLDTPAVTAIVDADPGRSSVLGDGRICSDPGESPVITAGSYPLEVATAEGTWLLVSRGGDVIRRSEATNNQRIVVTPFRDETDSTIVSALHISNEGTTPSYVEWRKDLRIQVRDPEKFFLVALANLTVGQNDVSGNIEPLAADDHFDGTTFTDGRVALYAKGKIQGRYLLTAQLDSTEDELENLSDNLRREDPRRLFRQLDPDRYYPVYGDDSTTTTDVDTQGAFYLRLDWDHNRALWGNYNTGMTDTELMHYNRTLYGAQLSLETNETTEFGDTERELTVFGSQAQSVPARVAFEATGGSLYYLQHTDIVQGSEKVRVEVRRRDTQQVLERNVLLEGRDYDVDALQGRIVLRRPLSQVVLDRGPSIIRTRPLEGDDVFLIVDYEYVPRSFMAEDLTYGGRGKVWLNDHVGIGATQVVDERNGLDYDLAGLDLTLRAGPGSYLSVEAAQSEANQSGANLISLDGGMSFQSQSLSGAGPIDGDAVAIEGRLNLGDFWDELDGDIRAWNKTRDSGFSTGRLDDGIETTDTGIEANWRAGENFSVSAGCHRARPRAGLARAHRARSGRRSVRPNHGWC